MNKLLACAALVAIGTGSAACRSEPMSEAEFEQRANAWAKHSAGAEAGAGVPGATGSDSGVVAARNPRSSNESPNDVYESTCLPEEALKCHSPS